MNNIRFNVSFLAGSSSNSGCDCIYKGVTSPLMMVEVEDMPYDGMIELLKQVYKQLGEDKYKQMVNSVTNDN